MLWWQPTEASTVVINELLSDISSRVLKTEEIKNIISEAEQVINDIVAFLESFRKNGHMNKDFDELKKDDIHIGVDYAWII